MATNASILRKWQRKHKYTAIQMSRALDVSPARVYNWFNGEGIPVLRARDWARNPDYPATVRELGEEILANIRVGNAH